MFKILIAGIMATSKIKIFWNNISTFFYHKLPYAKFNIVIIYLLEIQQKDLIIQTVQKQLATLNVNVYFYHLGKSYSKVKGVLYYDVKPYIPETFSVNLLEKNYNDLLVRHFRIEKTLKLLLYKYYQLKIRVNIEKYIQGCYNAEVT